MGFVSFFFSPSVNGGGCGWVGGGEGGYEMSGARGWGSETGDGAGGKNGLRS